MSIFTWKNLSSSSRCVDVFNRVWIWLRSITLVPTLDTLTQRGSQGLKFLVHLLFVECVHKRLHVCAGVFSRMCVKAGVWCWMSFLITPLYLLRQGTSVNPARVGFIGLAGWLTLGTPTFSSWALDLQVGCLSTRLLCGAGYLNSGLHAYGVSTLSNGHLSSPSYFLVITSSKLNLRSLGRTVWCLLHLMSVA